MSSSASSTKKREQAYALVSTRGSKLGRRVPLPARIGVSGKNDIIVNVQALADHAFTLTAAGGKLVLVREPKGEAVDLHTLKNLGLVAKGPIRGDVAVEGGMARTVREALGREKAWFQGLPGVAQKALLGMLPQGLRLAAWASALGGLVVLGLSAPEATRLDLSKQPIELTFDAVKSDTLGANPKSADFVKGYEQGITFNVDVPAEQKGHPLVFSFQVAGLNIGNELELKVNGKKAYASAAEADCAQDVCVKSLRIDGKLVKAGNNVLQFKHNEPQSSYFLAKLHVRPLPALSDVEREQLEHWFGLAQRAYDERNIVPENLVTAKSYASKVTKLASERDGVEAVSSKAQILEAEVDRAFAATVQEYWTAHATAEKLGNKADMEQALGQLLKLYPNARSEEHAEVMEKLQELKEPKQ